MTPDEIAEEFDLPLMKADGYDDCVVGVLVESASIEPHRVALVYDADAVIDKLMSCGMSHDEAEEFFSFNIAGAYVGEHTPVFMRRSRSLVDLAVDHEPTATATTGPT